LSIKVVIVCFTGVVLCIMIEILYFTGVVLSQDCNCIIH
jgi:hypothetical protein